MEFQARSSLVLKSSIDGASDRRLFHGFSFFYPPHRTAPLGTAQVSLYMCQHMHYFIVLSYSEVKSRQKNKLKEARTLIFIESIRSIYL